MYMYDTYYTHTFVEIYIYTYILVFYSSYGGLTLKFYYHHRFDKLRAIEYHHREVAQLIYIIYISNRIF